MNSFNLQKVSACLTLRCVGAGGPDLNTFKLFRIACWAANALSLVSVIIKRKHRKTCSVMEVNNLRGK
jgi:hypothetical protein